MEQGFDPYRRNFASLSVKDLLDARDAYHVHLCHLENVFATAVGRYLIRNDDPDGRAFVPAKEAVKTRETQGPRTLENSAVREWSWPCVLVLVRQWQQADELRRQKGQLVPPFLYLPDGRVVPVCVVEASLFDGQRPTLGPLRFASHLLGGGYPVVTEVQSAEHIGSIGCLVTDGSRFYGLTNHHVAGEAGTEVSTLVKGVKSRIGTASRNALGKAPFTEIYPGLSGTKTMSNLDVGLIDVDDAAQWTSRVFGLGALGALLTFDADTATLDWIGCDTVAFGAASGRLEGEIKALFYRYRTLGGTDYVSDFLIGGRDGADLRTMPGDSGTLWCIGPHMFGEAEPAVDEEAAPIRYRPFAIQWGGHKLSGDGDRFTQYALATSLAVACRELDVDLVADRDAELTEYWGEVGHYKIAQIAISRLGGELRSFMQENLDRITYDASKLGGDAHFEHDPLRFVPLADVPDIVWKTNMNRGGTAARPQENWTHYADLDLPGADGHTLDDIIGDQPMILDIDRWVSFYRNAPRPANDKSGSKHVNMGSLPFRIWQIFDAMVESRDHGHERKFLCAAGILAHYIGDACQPLHGSVHADGLDGASTGVHSAYETRMVDVFAARIRTLLAAFDFSTVGGEENPIDSGYAAACECIRLMRRCADRLPPAELCAYYVAQGGGKSKPMLEKLWTRFGGATVACLADGAVTLARLWQAAYDAAPANAFAGRASRAALKEIYERPDFLASLHLNNLNRTDYRVPVHHNG